MKKTIVNASEAGQAAYCPHSLSLSKRNAKAHKDSVRLQHHGTKEHDKLTEAVLSGRAQEQDRRCYVATYAFGEGHPVTQSLRDWRDASLMSNSVGRGLVVAYYAVSPYWVRLCERSTVLSALSRRIVAVVSYCVSKGGAA